MRPFCCLLLLLALPLVALAESGIRGRIAWRGELVPGVTVRAFNSIEDIAAEKAVAVAEPSQLDGTYHLDLPPGSYYLTASDARGEPQPGNYFCYYSGSPVRVAHEDGEMACECVAADGSPCWFRVRVVR